MTIELDEVELYRFTAASQAWHYTAGDQAAEHGNATYSPEPIERDEQHASSDITRSELRITVPRGNEVAALWIAHAPQTVVHLNVFRQRASQTDLIWHGRVLGCEFSGSRAQLQCEPVYTSLRRSSLRARFSANCRHALYDAGCGVVRAEFTDQVTLDAVAGRELTAAALTAQPDQWYRGGVVTTAAGHRRMIVDHTGDTVRLTAPLAGLAEGDAVSITAGCDHSIETCNTKFDNLERFGGFPAMPDLNPFGGTTLF